MKVMYDLKCSIGRYRQGQQLFLYVYGMFIHRTDQFGIFLLYFIYIAIYQNSTGIQCEIEFALGCYCLL